MPTYIPVRLKLLAAFLLFGGMQTLSGFALGRVFVGAAYLDAVQSLTLALFAVGAAWGLWHGRRWGAACLFVLGIIGFTKYLVPAAPRGPIDTMFLLVPASLYGLTIAYAWRNTSGSVIDPRQSRYGRTAD
jgi:hypothetical protein